MAPGGLAVFFVPSGGPPEIPFHTAETVVPDREGQFEVKVTADDPKRDDPVEATTRFWAVNDNFHGQNLDYTNLQLITERDVYEKGETCRILINAPVKDHDCQPWRRKRSDPTPWRTQRNPRITPSR